MDTRTIAESLSEAERGKCNLCHGRGYYLERFADNFFTPCRRCNPRRGMRRVS